MNTRDCTDNNRCGVSTNKPSESMSCSVEGEQPPQTEEQVPVEETPSTETTGQQTGAEGTTPTITPPTGTSTGEEQSQQTDWLPIIGAIVVIVIIGVVGLGVLGGGGALYFLKKPKGLKGL